MSELAARLAAVIGPANVLADEAARALAGSDLFEWPAAVMPELVARPGDAAQTAAVLALLAAERRAAVPRGAGLSYTAGAVPHAPAIVLDMTRLDSVAIDPDDLVARVGAGASWAAVTEAAASHGLRAAAPAPISGNHSTIAGAASQNLPGGMDGFIGLEVALADGSLVRTGASSRGGFWRHHGPDLTGLFLGDCGAFGVKTEIALRLVPEKPAAFASFAFATGTELVAALVVLMRARAVTRGLAMDRLRARAAAALERGEAARIAGAVMGRAGSIGEALRDLAQMAKAGRGGEDEAPWSLHLTAEADTPRAAEERLEAARAMCGEGREIENVVPKALRARPFSIRGMVGPDGQRWVPVHGIVSLSRATAAMAALEAAVEGERAAVDAAGMSVHWVLSSLGAYVTIEPMLYWPDALEPIHLAFLSSRHRERFGGFAPAPEARALARRLRLKLRDVLDAHDAVHAQLGRFYRLGDEAAPLARRIKAALDPDGRMNPGVLGL